LIVCFKKLNTFSLGFQRRLTYSKFINSDYSGEVSRETPIFFFLLSYVKVVEVRYTRIAVEMSPTTNSLFS